MSGRGHLPGCQVVHPVDHAAGVPPRDGLDASLDYRGQPRIPSQGDREGRRLKAVSEETAPNPFVVGDGDLVRLRPIGGKGDEETQEEEQTWCRRKLNHPVPLPVLPGKSRHLGPRI